jgi:hypothetical protein
MIIRKKHFMVLETGLTKPNRQINIFVEINPRNTIHLALFTRPRFGGSALG